MKSPEIVLKKVSVHNLKKVDLTLKPGQLVVFTGVSGSGKSSLAFDTIYVEGQRRYIESLSHQARRSLGDLPKPEAESISGIAPTIAIEQKTAGKTPRSTVGTMTGIYDFLRVVYAKIGVPHCPISKEPVALQSREKITKELQSLPKDKKLLFLAPYAKGKKGEFSQDFGEILSKGFMRVRVDGEIVSLEEEIKLDEKGTHDVDIVVDRLKGSDHARIAEAVNLSLELGKGFFSVLFPDTDEEKIFSQFAYSAKSDTSYGPLEAHDFSFNHPEGMCPKCHGIGISADFDLNKIINPELSIAEDCCEIASSYSTIRGGNIYNNLAKIYTFNIKTPWKKLSEKAKHVFLHGTEKKWTRMYFVHPQKKKRSYEYVQWKGVLHEARERLNIAKSDLYRKKLGALMVEGKCPACKGSRIKPYPAETKLGGKQIAEITSLPLSECLAFFQNLIVSPIEEEIAGELFKEIRTRLEFLLNVGLSYISLERTAPTLSGGESQRVRLASQIGAGLVGAIYVLDEPSIGLHPSDHHKLIETILRLRDQGNTVIVVEHDVDTILAADTIVDVGPGAGIHGGEILGVGSVKDIIQNPRSLTGGYLSGRLKIEIPKKRRKVGKEAITIRGAKHHNLQSVNVKIPLGGLICVTGVSGSGKSSLIADTLYPALSCHFHGAELPVGAHEKIDGLKHIDKVIAVDQSPIGRTPRSNAATYIQLFDEIRDLFAKLPESKLRGYTEGHFSFNVKEGSCSYCSGRGSVRMDMDFMEDAWVECPQCEGKQFDPEILNVRFKEHNISDILNTDVEKALGLFESIPSIYKKLSLLSEVGLDYLTLGQPSTTLSGGEAQRIKLAKELVRPSTGKTLYILDEPTTGLHFHDVQKLISILQKLVDKGNTVLVIEHNLDLIKSADWIVDLGPGPGIYGGKLTGTGTPEAIAKLNTPTGKSLGDRLGAFKKKELAKIERQTRIDVRGACQNNLKSVSLSLPRGSITVFTGPSGSGKSSLAFDTLYAEGQRRYIETLSTYARTLVKQLPKPKLDAIEGLAPSIAIEQKTGGLNPRSTIGTITEIYDLLRVFYAHLGTAFDPETGEEIQQISKEYVVNRALSELDGEKLHILAPLLFERKESFEELTSRLNMQGFLRIRLNQTYYELDEKIPFEKNRKNEIFLVVDRLAVNEKSKERLFEAVTKASETSKGLVTLATKENDLFFNLAFSAPSTGKSYPPIIPQTFSFNHDAGMCLECQGLGITYGAHLIDEPRLKSYSILDVVDRFFKDKGSGTAYTIVEDYFKKCNIDVEAPIKTLLPSALEILFSGGPEKHGLRWIGIEKVLARASRMAKKEIKEKLLPSMKVSPCSTCKGARLNPLALNVRIQGVSIADFCSMGIDLALGFIQKVPVKKEHFLFEAKEKIEKSLKFLSEIGLSYLSLDRSAPTLSGGELQRIRLARQLGSGLTSCLYVLDEPTIGLHPSNSERLNNALKNLRDLGNTLILVEHDPMTIQVADYVVDFGPKAGDEGGHITARGTLEEILKNPNSLTGAYLSGRKSIPIPKKRRPFNPGIRIENASLNNLKDITLEIPYSAITCLTGVSGSGKSTLLRHLLKPAAEKVASRSRKAKSFKYLDTTFYGLGAFEKVITIDQSPIGQTARANVSTYSEVQPLIRSLFASMPRAKAKGLSPGHFSPNHLRGMCRTCWGLGYRNVNLQFLPSVRVVCESCKGNRLNAQSLEVFYKDKHFGEVLEMSIAEALVWFENIPRIVKRLKILESVGLSYLCLGREVASLSGGEAQRLRLSTELAKRETGKTLYLIDEPTVGLHAEDVARLLPIFHMLADKKNTLIIIEHNVDVIQNADYVIDLGPDAGPDGGQVLATGTPEEIAKVKESKTGKYLRSCFKIP